MHPFSCCQLVLFLLFSPCSGESEGLCAASDQLLVLWQQPVHQPQRQRGVGVWRRLRLQLRVRDGGASHQEEAAHGGQLREPISPKLAVGRWRTRKGERDSSSKALKTTFTPSCNNTLHSLPRPISFLPPPAGLVSEARVPLNLTPPPPSFWLLHQRRRGSKQGGRRPLRSI